MVKYICKCPEFKSREVSKALAVNFSGVSGKQISKTNFLRNFGLRNPSIEIGDIVSQECYLHKVIYIDIIDEAYIDIINIIDKSKIKQKWFGGSK